MKESDIELAFAFLRDVDVAYARNPPPPKRLEGARAWVDKAVNSPSQIPWVLETNDGDSAGYIVLQGFDPVAGVAEVGALVMPPFRRKGLVTEALRAVTAWAFANLEVHRLFLVHDLSNHASCKAALACNYQREGISRSARPGPDGTRIDSEVHAITRADFENLTALADLSI